MTLTINRCICGWSAFGSEFKQCPQCGLDLVLLTRIWNHFQTETEALGQRNLHAEVEAMNWREHWNE